MIVGVTLEMGVKLTTGEVLALPEWDVLLVTAAVALLEGVLEGEVLPLTVDDTVTEVVLEGVWLLLAVGVAEWEVLPLSVGDTVALGATEPEMEGAVDALTLMEGAVEELMLAEKEGAVEELALMEGATVVDADVLLVPLKLLLSLKEEKRERGG